MHRTFKRFGLVFVTVLAMMLAATSAASASAISGSAISGSAANRIGPQQYFAAGINHSATGAVIRVNCAAGRAYGHPAPGQHVVLRKVTGRAHPLAAVRGLSSGALANGATHSTTRIPVGYTGLRGRAIAVRVNTTAPRPVSNAPVAVLHRYGRWTIPQRAWLPCRGGGAVTFSPRPQSQYGHGVSIPVKFVAGGLLPW